MVLLVLVGVLGLKVVSESNDRVERLGALQLRATAYREIGTYAEQLRVLLALRAGGSDATVYAGGAQGSSLSSATLAAIDTAIASTITRSSPRPTSRAGLRTPARRADVTRQDPAGLPPTSRTS